MYTIFFLLQNFCPSFDFSVKVFTLFIKNCAPFCTFTPPIRHLNRKPMRLEDLALQFTPGLGVKGVVHLLACFGDAEQIFQASAEELIGRAELRAEVARAVVERRGFAAAEAEVAYCRRHQITPLASTDAAYPALLREIPDYPHIIYVRGCVEALSKRCLSMVGTREATPYGQQLCNRFVGELAGRVPDLCIVSGLAFGIDVASHRAAIAERVPTVGVLANVLPGVMPTAHTQVAREILDQGGALVTELHSQTKQNGSFYLARNRIIAGLSEGCIVVESGAKGGSLVTAHYADSYNRCVMAPPGRITDRTSSGTNHLLCNHKAEMILSAEDIIRHLGWDLGENPGLVRPKAENPPLTKDEEGLLGCFRTSDPLPLEELVELTGLNSGELATLLLGLELSGAIQQLPGNRYMRR